MPRSASRWKAEGQAGTGKKEARWKSEIEIEGAKPLSVPELQVLLFALTGGWMLSAVWMMSHARDVVLVLSQFLPLDPGEGRVVTTPKGVCTALTIFGFSVVAEGWVLVRSGVQF
ncbi:hypothetical protein NAP1_14643 [Erythrobacter sp. NAP1]|uniref:hypothetical protein n=1 Tax=Erythrobacter sp. NAP1 TaxID=237727 RepID=UPI00006875C9|nr:hypothetical protein [Erythrobacter sp. NAP1]EAQ28846.1 hypothetical protein NAP1_14643 [Erythrobacter sp. NAP1]